MKKSITRNYIYNLTYQILILILPLVTTPYISRVLGVENIGIYSYTLSISAYFILFGSLGIALYGQRELAYNQKNKKKYSLIFWEIVLLKIITMSISLLIFYFTFAKYGQYHIYYKILIIEIIGNCIDISWLFQGLEEFKKTVSRNIVVKLISIVSIFMFVKTSNDLPIYYLIYVLSILFGNISLWLYLPKFLEKIKIKDLNILRHLKPTLGLFIPQIAIQVYTLLDRTMVGTIVIDKSEVGYYDQSQKIIKIFLALITSLGTVMLPRIANTFASGEKEKLTSYMKKSFNIVFLLSFPLIFGIISVSDSFVPIFFGAGYEKVSILMCVISPLILLIGLSNVTGTQYLLPTRRQKEFTISVVCGAVINFILNLFLISEFSALGASIGTVIAELAVTSIQMYFVRNDFNLSKVFKLSKKYFISGVIMFVICLFVRRVLTNNLISMCAQVILGCFTYFTCLLFMKDEFIYEILNKVKGKVKVLQNEK